MDRAERVGLGVALAGHLALLALLSLSIVARPGPLPKLAEPIDVQLVDAVGARSAAPVVAKEAPAPSKAPERAPPEDAAPEPEPEAVPPAPTPKPVPPKPVPPKPAPPKPAPPKVEPPKPTPKAPPPKPAAVEKPVKPAPAKPAPAKETPARPAKAEPAKPATPPVAKPGAGKAAKRGGGIESDDFLKGITPEKSPGKAQAPHAQAIGAFAMNGLAAAIKRQIQPCYELGSLAGTPAMGIVTTLNLRFNKDGSVGGTTLVAQSGIDDSNASYAKQIADVGKRAVLRCAPLKLPPELYEGGWDNLNFRFTPGQMQ